MEPWFKLKWKVEQTSLKERILADRWLREVNKILWEKYGFQKRTRFKEWSRRQ